MYPVATMKAGFAHPGSREQMLGAAPEADQESAWSLEDNVRRDGPPTFLLHAGDDASVPVENSLRLYDALRAAKVPTEMHLFEEGGHGFGLRFTTGKPVAAWPGLVEAWWKRKGFI
jgi:acetyl esterase/lipase